MSPQYSTKFPNVIEVSENQNQTFPGRIPSTLPITMFTETFVGTPPTNRSLYGSSLKFPAEKVYPVPFGREFPPEEIEIKVGADTPPA